MVQTRPTQRLQPKSPTQELQQQQTTGISIHRFQMFAWTLILGVIFIGSVYKNLEMPQFSATLLGLMGISSGTYLGFKVPEKASTDAPAGTAPEAAAGPPPSR